MTIKKVFLVCGIVTLCLSSCTTITKTASSIEVESCLKSETNTDMEVENSRISYTYYPKKSVRRAGLKNVKATAVAEALKANGNGDVLVEPQFETRIRRGLLGTKIKSVTVTGYPAKYKNFRIVNK